MGYFSNGTHGDMFEGEYCARCIHGDATRSPDAKEGCPVMLAHILFAYEECNTKSNAKAILDMLIEPRPDGMFNECKMFVRVDGVVNDEVRRCRRTDCLRAATTERDGYCAECAP